jgi:predicted ATPase
MYGIILHQLRRDEATVRAWSERMALIATEQRLALYEALSFFARGWLLATGKSPRSGLSELRQGVDACINLGMRLFEPYHHGVIAEAYWRSGEAQVGMDVLEKAIRFVNTSGLRFWEAELLRLKGTFLTHLAPGEPQETEACYQEALSVARHQQAKSLELRAAMSLTRLWRDQGRRDEARDLLAAVYGWFTEGFDTPDLRDAAALLAELN